jgi:glycosyltransferase involved in cell wall biosynthesis
MRVVWITHNYPRRAGDLSGAFLHPLAVALRQLDIDVRVVVPSDAGQGGRHALDGVPVRRVRYASPAGERLAYGGTMANALRTPAGWWRLARLGRALRRGARAELAGAARGQYLVHAHWWIPAGLAAPPDVPMMLTSHGTDARLLDRFPISAIIARPVYRRARLVTTVSQALARTVERRTGVTVADDCVHPMPVVDAVRPWTDRSGGLVAIGRLTRQKRFALALDAFAALRASQPELTLTIVGDGPERAALQHQAAALGVTTAVRFTGTVDPERVPDLLASAVCCLMPARDEGFGLAAAEALMQGVPVVACTDGGGLLDVVGASRGGRVVAPTAGAIATAAAELMASADAAAAAHDAGRHWREQLSAACVADRCLDWYGRVLHA